MDRSNNTKISLLSCSRRAKRTAALLCAALAGLGLARGAAAQNIPQQNSPPSPTPYQSPLFHGGGSDPTLTFTPPFLNPLYGQLQGTPTETVPGTGAGPGYPVQVPSFLFGNYNLAEPPAAAGNYYPNHLADGDIFSWAAPFDYNTVTGPITFVDDSSIAVTPNFTVTGNWQTQTLGASAGTADGGGYYRLPPGLNGTATWTLTVPVPAVTAANPTPVPVPGGYSLYFHLPANIADDAGNIEPRSTQVIYTITVNGSNPQTNTATVSQTDSNSLQFLAGPFLLAAGDTVVVTLQRDATHNQNTYQPAATPPVLDYLVADSMTLQPAIGDVQSTPTAINIDSYPNEFKRAKYWGVYVPATTIAPVASVAGVDSAPPDTAGGGTPTPNPVPLASRILRSGATAVNDTAGAFPLHADPLHSIRQLVYFGRQEPTFSNGVTVDDSASAAAFSAGAFVPSTYTNVGATNNNYHVAAGIINGGQPALWTMAAPTGGDYYVTVHLPATPLNATGAVLENRSGFAFYTITYGNPLVTRTVQISQITGTAKDVTLPTGTISLTQGETLTVTLNPAPGDHAAGKTIVADSVRITTGGAGAIYCVDGFTGAVVWRYQTVGSQNGASAPVFSSPAVTKINVMVQPAAGGSPALYANKLVVIVGDNNGLVYCLDAMGNGDGTSNSAVINANTSLPNYIAQPSYGPFTGPNGLPTTAPVPVDDPTYTPHVGTTGVYWIYRPDVNNPKYITGANIGQVKRDNPTIPSGNTLSDPLSDLPVPASFNTASPNIFVNPNVSTTVDATGYIPALTVGAATLPPSNAIVYIGNSNGVLYALDATGVGLDSTSANLFYNSGTPNSTNKVIINPGDPFSASQDLRHLPGVFQQTAAGAADPNYDPTDPIVPTPQTLWWFSLRGPDPNSSDNASNADIESAPALYLAAKADAAQPTGYDFTPTVYIGSAHELESTSNIGRLYALNGLVGPSGNNGNTDPTKQPDPTQAGYTGPGSLDYNLAQRPQINKTDKSDWAFPDAYDTTPTGPTRGGIGQSSNKMPRPALGNVTGSPVVFTDTNETGLLADGVTKARTRIYFAANSGLEVPYNSPDGTTPSDRPDDIDTGRVWAVNLDGSVGTTTNTSGANAVPWSYPLANDPNNVAKDKIHEPQAPMGSFLHGTPAIGFIQFPTVITNGNGSPYVPIDVVHAGGIKGQIVPMLYIATRGVNDTALYAIDIDGNVNPALNAAAPTGNDDERLIYRVPSFDGSIFQSSPYLISNSSVAGGNGGSVYVTAGSSVYDYSATPISNPTVSGQGFPLIRLNRAYTGFGPVSSPTAAASNTTDLFGLILGAAAAYQTGTANETIPVGGFTQTVTDWIYVGDTSTGFCRGITPYDTTDAGIPAALAAIVPQNPDPPGSVNLTTSLQVYLVPNTPAASSSQSSSVGYGVGSDKALPVYDWGENVYIRIKNVVPPGLTAAGQPSYVVIDDAQKSQSVSQRTYFGDGGPIEFDISDSSPGAPADHGTIPAILYATPSTPLRDGFIVSTDPDPGVTTSPPVYLVDPTSGQGYIGAYTYAISDGTARRNTPGATRHILNVRQVVHVYTTTDGVTYTPATPPTQILTAQVSSGNEVSKLDPVTGKYDPKLTYVPPVDQPTFGILNPLAVRGGGIPITSNSTIAQQIGSQLGPFRGANLPPPPAGGPGDLGTLEALANGNRILINPPASTSGGGGSTIQRNYAETSPDTQDAVVVTATGLIPHNSSSDNFDNSNHLTPPTGSVGSGLSGTYFGSSFAPYACDVADRSALGLVAKQLRVKAGTVSGGGDGLYWNDNTNNNNGSGHDSAVNFLPWETPPVGYGIGANPSVDYPDISPSHIATYLHRYDGFGGAEDMTLGNAYAQQATGINTDAVDRTVYLNPIQFHINIPRFQSANQQLYQEIPGQGKYDPTGQIAPPNSGGLSATNNIFPMGYVTSRRIYVPDQAGFYREGAAYREVRVYTGVPPDFGLQMGTNTVDIGLPVPSAFGVQTGLYTGYTNGANTDFNPYNTAFHDYYQALPIFNTGNVNLINVHLDQQIALSPGGPISPLLMSSDAVDPLSYIPAWDYQGITGPSILTGKNNFLVRSSLDSDIAVINPGLTSGYAGQYPGPTFHKARVGDANPTQMTMPDVPHDNIPGSLFFVQTDGPGDGKPSASSVLPFAPTFAATPYVSIAIPFGTPVGTYHLPKTIQAFEGYDNPLTYNSLYPPLYGGILPGQGHAANTAPIDYLVSQNPPPVGPFVKGASGQHPVSSNGTDIKVSVVEDRMTDGFTFGGLPMVDATGAGPNNAAGNPAATPDFAPAAFRDPATGNLSMYWTTGRNAPGFGIQAANVAMNQSPTLPGGVKYFQPLAAGQSWWNNFAPFTALAGTTNSGLTIAQDVTDPTNIFSFVVNVKVNPPTVPYQNTLLCYPVTPATGVLSPTAQDVTNDPSLVKYGVKGLYFKSANGFMNNLWAFWTTTVRGRTAINYNSNIAPGTATWPLTTGTLPVPAGLTAVANPAPLLLYSPAATGGGFIPAIDVTYSGTGPDGNIDLYESRYLPDAATASKLNLVPFPDTTEVLLMSNGRSDGWMQARDVAWSRTGVLNLAVRYGATTAQILYDTTVSPAKPLFSRAVFDKASGYLVLTGVSATGETPDAQGSILHTVYVDYATGRVRFVPALRLSAAGSLTPDVRATFDPLARRITTDSRADTTPVTFLDGAQKANEGLGLNPVAADRRWYVWRKSGIGGAAPSSTIYYKTQRLTGYLPFSVDTTKALSVTVNAAAVTVDVQVMPAVLNPNGTVKYPASTRLFFPISSGSEGQPFTATYTDLGGNPRSTSDVVQWQDEIRSNDDSVPPTNSVDGLSIVEPGYAVPLANAVNEDNVSAFLDPFANATTEHKVWLFWNSTRNGTADVYYETINPLFAAVP